MIERNAHHCDPLMGCAHNLGDLAISACVGHSRYKLLVGVSCWLAAAGTSEEEKRSRRYHRRRLIGNWCYAWFAIAPSRAPSLARSLATDLRVW